MKTVALRMPIERFVRSPELASISILEVALYSCEVALLAANLDLAHGDIEDLPHGSSALRASAVLRASRRLANALADYRDALDREERREAKIRQQLSF